MHVVGAGVLVLQVVGVLPHVDAEEGHEASGLLKEVLEKIERSENEVGLVHFQDTT